MSRNNDEVNKIIAESVVELLKMGVDTYNRVKITLLSYQSEYEPCNEWKRKLFAFTDQHRPLLIEMKGGVV
jgi:hypothetical protein